MRCDRYARSELTLTSNRLCLLVAIWIVATCNLSFWKQFFAINDTGAAALLFAAAMALAQIGLNLLLLRLLTPGRTLRVMLILLLAIAATAGWFMDTYGVVIDSGMLRNAWQTHPAEAREVVGWPLLWRLAWQAALPGILIWKVSLSARTTLIAVRDYATGMAASVLLLIGATLPLYSSYASYFRNQDEARYRISPANVLVGSATLARKMLRSNAPYLIVGADAKRGENAAAKPLLTVVVIGETARAANFSLGGYTRDTNPLLAKHDIYYYRDVQSCGTSTAVSLPCMFSGLQREEFDLSRTDRRDNVLDILQRAGLAVEWIENQSGCKKICARVTEVAASTFHPASCRAGECLDEVLIHALDARLREVARDTVLVLHSMGSHGPAYYRRVPPQFELFKPVCHTARIETCSDEQIVNSYDNSIAYTDYILATLIERLQQQSQLDSAFVYVSDHGESLGEGGLYLHGYPYVLAPAVQKQVPLILWFSTGTESRLRMNPSCLHATLGQSRSHDHLSHTLLGLNDIQTAVYRPELDLLRSCRSEARDARQPVVEATP
jgi:lipid A ethanolaminephosphotransferase